LSDKKHSLKSKKNSLRLKELQGMVRVHLPLNYSRMAGWVRTNTAKKVQKKVPCLFYSQKKFKEYKRQGNIRVHLPPITTC
jgi:D-mannonate dehydratase